MLSQGKHKGEKRLAGFVVFLMYNIFRLTLAFLAEQGVLIIYFVELGVGDHTGSQKTSRPGAEAESFKPGCQFEDFCISIAMSSILCIRNHLSMPRQAAVGESATSGRLKSKPDANVQTAQPRPSVAPHYKDLVRCRP